jgi:hypothetical protein
MLPLFNKFEGNKKHLEIYSPIEPKSWRVYGDINSMGKEVTDEFIKIYVPREGELFVGIIPGESFSQIETPIFWGYGGGALILAAWPGYKFFLRGEKYVIRDRRSMASLEILPNVVGVKSIQSR